MAIVDSITGENIEKFRGVIDFYMLRGILPVARKWPVKPKPPYSALQAEAMAVFAIACECMGRISTSMLEEWRKGSEGIRNQWTDVFKGLIMHYWKLNKSIAPIALNYSINETVTEYQVVWNMLQVYIDPLIPEELYDMQTTLILKEDLLKITQPVYFTLYDDEGTRLVAPFILFEPVI